MATYPVTQPLRSRVRLAGAAYAFLLGLGLLIGLFVLFTFIRTLLVPYLGVDVALQEGAWRVGQVDDNGTAYRDGIRHGDEVLKVNGVNPADVSSGPNYVGAFRAQSIEVLNETGNITRSAATTGPVPAGAIQESIGFFTIASAFWLVGFLSFTRRRWPRPVLFLYAMCLSVALTLVSDLGAMRGWVESRPLEIAGLLWSPWLVARLFFEFPFRKRLNILGRDCANLLYAPPCLLLLTYVLVGHQEAAFYAWYRPLAFLVMAIGFSLSLAVIAHSYVASGFARFRHQIRIIGIGVAVGFLPLVLLSIIPQARGLGPVIPSTITTMCFVAVPVSLGYTMSNHKLFDIDQAIGRITWYGLLTCALVASYVFLLGLSEALFPGLGTPWRVAMLVVFTVIALASSGPARASLRQGIEARLNRGRYDYRSASYDIVADLASKTELEDVARLLAVDTSRILRLEGACVLLNPDGKRLTVAAAHGNFDGDSGLLGKLLEVCRDLSEDQQFPNQAPAGSGAAFLVPLSRGKNPLGVLALSAKTSGPDFGVDDTYFIFSIQTQASLVIDNALLLKETKKHALELENALTQQREYAAYLENSRRILEQSYVNIVRTLVLAVESRSPYTKGHSDRVTQVARRIGAKMGLPAEELTLLQTAGRIHDIGKIGTPDNILLKSGPLEHHERAEVELHPMKGVEIVRFLDFLRDVVPLVESHHEWFNGEGYPSGLRGDEIPFGARILAVADAFDAMTSDRPYRRACTCEEAIERL
ncbi:MAG: HD domain-containing protein, partial [Dehalococcoidia bacterium]|nr:HD domain-containing protein [Dehalococcoidia bacterium]